MIFSLNDAAVKKVLGQEISVISKYTYPQLGLHFKGTYPESPLWNL